MHWGGEGEGLPFAMSLDLGGGAAREHCFSAGVSGVPARTGRSVLMLFFAIVILIGFVISPFTRLYLYIFPSMCYSHPYWYKSCIVISPLYTSLSFYFPFNVLAIASHPYWYMYCHFPLYMSLSFDFPFTCSVCPFCYFPHWYFPFTRFYLLFTFTRHYNYSHKYYYHHR